jgi:hypothetical protein
MAAPERLFDASNTIFGSSKWATAVTIALAYCSGASL